MKVLWDSPCVTILWKLYLSKGGAFLRGEVGAGIGLHTGCKGVSGYYYHC